MVSDIGKFVQAVRVGRVAHEAEEQKLVEAANRRLASVGYRMVRVLDRKSKTPPPTTEGRTAGTAPAGEGPEERKQRRPRGQRGRKQERRGKRGARGRKAARRGKRKAKAGRQR